MMAPVVRVPERPGIFLLTFALMSAVLLPVWQFAGPAYSYVLTWFVGVGCTLIGLPSLGAGAAGAETINPGLVAGIALFGATPSQSARWKLMWIGVLVLMLTSTHAILLVAQVHAVVVDLAVEADGLRPWLATGNTGDQATAASGSLHSAWYWLSPMVTAALWLTAGQRGAR